MATPAQARSGVLVISAWIEPDTGDFRARIMQTTDTKSSEHSLQWASSPTSVVAAVEDWLATLAI